MKKSHKIFSFLIVTTGVCLAAILPMTDAEEPTMNVEVVFDPTKPDTWDAAVAKTKQDQNAIIKNLIAVAEDKKRNAEERRKAIFLLGDIRTKESLDFLVTNVSLKIPVLIMALDVDTLKETPCMYVLWKGDWSTAKAVLDGLWAKDKTKTELLFFTEILKRILGEKLALAAVDDALFRTRDTQHKKNLTAIKTFLTEK